jgi:EAL domain-containing protein (putative c-di-GMP-specific phosphodiesterase class I)
MAEKRTPCERCEVLPHQFGDEMDLYLSTPVATTRDTLIAALDELGLQTSYLDDILRVHVQSNMFARLAEVARERLASNELEDTRVLTKEHGEDPRLSDFVSMRSLDSVIARIEGESLINILEQNSLVTHVQPILHASSGNAVFAYECLTRGVDENGETISPAYLFGTARKADLLFYLDRESRMTAIRSAAPLADRAKIFVNFNPTTIYRPEFCLASTMKVLAETGLTQSDVVFEVVESDQITDVEHLRRILNYYRERGFEVALDDLGAGYNSLTSLNDLRPDYMKLDIDLCRGVDVDPYRGTIAKNLIVLARDLGIGTIAEGIETEGEATWFANAGVDYIQGYYFARPLPVAEVLSGELSS